MNNNIQDVNEVRDSIQRQPQELCFRIDVIESKAINNDPTVINECHGNNHWPVVNKSTWRIKYKGPVAAWFITWSSCRPGTLFEFSFDLLPTSFSHLSWHLCRSTWRKKIWLKNDQVYKCVSHSLSPVLDATIVVTTPPLLELLPSYIDRRDELPVSQLTLEEIVSIGCGWRTSRSTSRLALAFSSLLVGIWWSVSSKDDAGWDGVLRLVVAGWMKDDAPPDSSSMTRLESA